MTGAHRKPSRAKAAETAVIIFAGWVIACVLVAVFVPVFLAIMAWQATTRKLGTLWHPPAASQREGMVP